MKNYSNEIAEVEVQITDIKRQRAQLELANNAKVKEVLENAFNYFKEFEIKVWGESATFHVKDQDGYNKEIFSLYFYSRYKEDTRLELSYYTTSTQSDFELERLISLGKVAQLIKSNSERVLKDIADVKMSDLGRENELYGIQNGYEKQLSQYRKAQSDNKKVEIELLLRGEGVEFKVPKEVTLKLNYFPRVNSIKIVEMSKSGKTCTVQYVTRDGYQTKEENCNVQKIVDQVVLYSKDIVEALFPQ
jgi:hypothetical protein